MNHPDQIPGEWDCGWCTEESSQGRIYQHHYRSSHLLLISLWGWLQAEPITSFVATWMADLACNQCHLRWGGGSGCLSVSLHETSDISEHILPLTVRNQGWTLSLNFCYRMFILFCICFVSSSSSSYVVLLFSSPYFSCRLVVPASSSEEFFSVQLPYPEFPFTSSSFPLLLVTVGIKVWWLWLEGCKDRETEMWLLQPIIQDVCSGWDIKK